LKDFLDDEDGYFGLPLSLGFVGVTLAGELHDFNRGSRTLVPTWF
jgi:hypothetical protein